MVKDNPSAGQCRRQRQPTPPPAQRQQQQSKKAAATPRLSQELRGRCGSAHLSEQCRGPSVREGDARAKPREGQDGLHYLLLRLKVLWPSLSSPSVIIAVIIIVVVVITIGVVGWEMTSEQATKPVHGTFFAKRKTRSWNFLEELSRQTLFHGAISWNIFLEKPFVTIWYAILPRDADTATAEST